jgi:hypothetical protein
MGQYAIIEKKLEKAKLKVVPRGNYDPDMGGAGNSDLAPSQMQLLEGTR